MSNQPADSTTDADQDLSQSRFQIVLLRVLAVQVITLLGLWWLQRHYAG